MNIFNSYGRRIEEQIRPISYPLAIKMLEVDGDIPEGSQRPKRDFGACMATCQCFALSRKFGVTIAQLFEDRSRASISEELYPRLYILE